MQSCLIKIENSVKSAFVALHILLSADYLYEKGGEDWHGDLPLAGTYSLDYLIGEAAFLRRGFGKQLVAALLSEIRRQPDAKRVIVQPDPANHASCGLLQACGFALMPQNGLYLYTL